MLELAECGKREHRHLTLTALIRRLFFAHLQHRHELTATRACAVDVLQTTGHGGLDQLDDARFSGNTSKGDMLFGRTDARLHDGVLAGGNRLHFDDGKRRVGRSRVTGEFRHGFARMGVLVFFHAFSGDQFAFDHIFGMTDAVLVDRETIHKPHAFAAQRTRDGKLVVTEPGSKAARSR